LFLLIMYKVTE